MLVLIASAFAAPVSECERTFETADLLEVVASADGAIAQMDAHGLATAKAALLVRLNCVREPLARSAQAAVHRVVATAAEVSGDNAHVPVALAGLLATSPGYQLPLELYPQGHPLRLRLSHASILLDDPGTRPLARLKQGWIEVDGKAAEAAPTARAAILQELDGQGRVVETRYVWPEDDLEQWAPGGKRATASDEAAELPTYHPRGDEPLLEPPESRGGAHLAASTGVRWASGLAFGSFLGDYGTSATYVRFEGGGTVGAVQVVGVGQLSHFNQPSPFSGFSFVAGDLLSVQLGAGVRLPLFFGRFSVAPHAELGLSLAESPITAEAEAELQADLGGTLVNPHAAGAFAQAGCELGFEVIPNAVTLYAAPDLGGEVGTGVGFAAALRFGAAARF